MAEMSRGKPVPLSKIADEENISLGYLERIFSLFKKAGIVKSEMGSRGGYELGRGADKISVLDIVRSLEKNSAFFYCFEAGEKVFCKASCGCQTISSISHIEKVIVKSLQSLKLSDLIKIK